MKRTNKGLGKFVLIVFVLITILGLFFTNNKNIFIKNYNKKERFESESSLNNYRGTIINVPIDSRPISRSNFEYLAKSARYNYIEVDQGLDGMNIDEVYYKGETSDTRDCLSEVIRREWM